MNRFVPLLLSAALALAAGAGCAVSTPTAEASTRPAPATPLASATPPASTKPPAPAKAPGPRDLLRQLASARVIRTSGALPRPVIDPIVFSADARLADPGQPFQVSDVVDDDTLPWRRLIWAVTDGRHYLVHYEAGGIAHSFHVMLLSFAPGDPDAKVLWHAAGFAPLADYAAFRAALDGNQLDDDPRVRR